MFEKMWLKNNDSKVLWTTGKIMKCKQVERVKMTLLQWRQVLYYLSCSEGGKVRVHSLLLCAHSVNSRKLPTTTTRIHCAVVDEMIVLLFRYMYIYTCATCTLLKLFPLNCVLSWSKKEWPLRRFCFNIIQVCASSSSSMFVSKRTRTKKRFLNKNECNGPFVKRKLTMFCNVISREKTEGKGKNTDIYISFVEKLLLLCRAKANNL